MPEDTYQNIGIDNIQALEGFSHAHISQQFDSTIEQANGNAALQIHSIYICLLQAESLHSMQDNVY